MRKSVLQGCIDNGLLSSYDHLFGVTVLMSKSKMYCHGVRLFTLILMLFGSSLNHLYAENSTSMILSDEVETLEVFEVLGTGIQQQHYEIMFSRPSVKDLLPIPSVDLLSVTASRPLEVSMAVRQMLRDDIVLSRSISTSPQLHGNPHPTYPRLARMQGWEGIVVVRIHVTAQGRVKSTRIQKSSGHSSLDEAAVESVREWQFLPAMDGEIPVTSTVDVPIRFSLTNSP